MQLGYIPFYTKNEQEIVWLNEAVDRLLLRVRNQWSFSHWYQSRHFQPLLCQRCGSDYRVERHHIRPVWSWVAELLLYERPTCLHDVKLLIQRIHHQEFDYVNLFAHLDWQPLCSTCHPVVGRQTNQMWREKLSSEYPILWKLRYSVEDFHDLVNRWYSH